MMPEWFMKAINEGVKADVLKIGKRLDERIRELEAENERLRKALEAMIGASSGYLMVNSQWWSMTAGQTPPTRINDATFEFENVIQDCLHQLAPGLTEVEK